MSTASVVPNSDPFRLAPFSALHNGGNDCDADANCLTADTVANVTLQLSDVGGATNANLINVCSYPSQEPNSDPSDCVAKPNSGVLTIIKTVHDVPTLFGDATTDTFTFNASAPSTSAVSSWSKTFTAVGTQTVVSQVRYDATTTLDLTEVLPGSGWKLELLAGARCSIQTATSTATGTDTDTGVTDLEIKSGLETICTFSNTEDLELTHARLTLVKNVQSDNGGTAAATDWTLSAAGPTNKSGAGGFTNEMVSAGSYALSETGTVAGYTNGTTFSCVKNGNAAVENNTIQLVGGDSATCTITNNDIAPRLTVIKHVVNDNGGTAVASAWTMDVTATDASQASFPGAESPGTTITLDAGAFSVAESGGPSGYSQTGAVGCTGTAVIGLTYTCTITNDDIAARLAVIKHVVNDNGGTAVASAWTMDVTATNPSQASFPGTESPGTTITLGAGSFSVAESGGPSGYSQTAAVGCTGTAVIGETYTCTITNNDIAPRLAVIKHVVNDNGGTAVASAWTMDVTATNPSQASFPGAESPGTTITLNAGSFSVGESGGPSGYSQTGAVGCSGTAAIGQTYTCTITNDDTAPRLTVIKHVVNDNGGTAVASAWTMNVTATDASQASFPGAESPGTTITLDAGAFSVAESGGPSGYSQTGAAGCTGTAAIGETYTCTITNDDIAARLAVIKHVVNDNGGGAAASAWTMNVTATNPSQASFPGAESPGTTVTLDAGCILGRRKRRTKRLLADRCGRLHGHGRDR